MMDTKINKFVLFGLGLILVLGVWKGAEFLLFLAGALGFLVTPKVISNAEKLQNRRKEQSNFEEAVKKNRDNHELEKQREISSKEQEVDKWLDR